MNEKQCIILFSLQNTTPAYAFAEYLCAAFNRKLICLGSGETEFDKRSLKPDLELVRDIIEAFDPVMFVFDYDASSGKNKKQIRKYLLAFRDLRVPYVGVPRKHKAPGSVNEVIVPVGFLPEEKEKAPWSNSFIKYCKASITLLRPKDRGSRAAKNVAFISDFLKTQKNSCGISDGDKSSFKIEFEAQNRFMKNADLFIISASRAYGLDDTFFGPKEYHVLRKSSKPVLIINPRDDIYVLCGD